MTRRNMGTMAALDKAVTQAHDEMFYAYNNGTGGEYMRSVERLKRAERARDAARFGRRS